MQETPYTRLVAYTQRNPDKLCSFAITMATAVSAGAATTGVRGGVWLCSFAVTMATAVSAGAATTGVRGGVWLCSFAVTMATAVSAGAATAGVRARWHRVLLLFSFRDYISYCSSSEVGVLEYVYGQ